MNGYVHFLNKEYVPVIHKIKNLMKSKSVNKIRLGLLVTIALVMFIAAIYFVGDRQQLFSSTFQISGVFSDISGLQVGNNVRFSGINVGIVDRIEQVTDTTVSVDMVILEDTRRFIKKNAIAVIASDGLMGSRIVQILPGSSSLEEVSDHDVLGTTQPVAIDEILGSLNVTAYNAALITDDLAVIMTSIREGKGTLGKLLMDSTMAGNVNQAMVNIKQGSGGFKQNMDAAGNSFLLRGAMRKKHKAQAKEVGTK
jgi:phospholipid/cholesterol/gamma-HCH transport system substrate-binding protein